MCANSTEPIRARGFTLLEFILVVLMLGILAVYTVPRLNTDAVSGGLFRDQVASTLQHARRTAASHRRLVCAGIGGTTVALSIATAAGATSCNQSLRLPSGESVLQSGHATSVISPAPLTLYFQPDGRISTDGGGLAPYHAELLVDGLRVAIVGETGHVR